MNTEVYGPFSILSLTSGDSVRATFPESKTVLSVLLS